MTDREAIIETAARALRQTYVYITREEAKAAATTVCATITPLIEAKTLEEAVKVLEILRTWYVAHGDTKAPLAPWVAADQLLTRLRAAEEPKQQVEEMKCSACGETRWLRKSMWHDTPICEPCFMVWYDPDKSIDQTDPQAVGALSMELKAAGKAPWVGKYAEPEDQP